MSFYTNQPKGRPLKNSDGRTVGYVSGETFYKTLDGSRHYIHTPPSIGIDRKVFDRLPAEGVLRIEARDLQSGDVLTTTWENFARLGLHLNRGFGEQLALTLDRWSRNGEPPDAPPASGSPQKTVSPPPPPSPQLALF